MVELNDAGRGVHDGYANYATVQKNVNPYILDVKSDIVNQRLYFLTTGKMPIFLQSEC